MSEILLTRVLYGLLLLSSLQLVAQNDIEGAYVLEGGAKLIVSGQPSSGFVRLREVENGNVYQLKRNTNRQFQSDSSFMGNSNPLSVYFKESSGAINALEIRPQNGASRTASKIALREEYFNFKSNDVELSAKLLLPQGRGPFPIIVIAQGSGKGSAIKNYFDQYLLPSVGIATLVYDKRGTGASGGTYTQLFEVLADDLVAGINALENHPSLDMNRLGVIGYSQGGWVAPLAALKEKKVKYVVVNYGLAMSVAEEDLLETPMKVAAMGFGKEDLKELKDLTKSVHHVIASNLTDGWDELENKIQHYQGRPWLAAVKNTQTWTGSVLQMGIEQSKRVAPQMLQAFDPYYDPLLTLKKLDIPMFWLFGADDIEAPVDLSIYRLKELKSAGKPIDIRVFDSTDHGMYLFSNEDNTRRPTKHPDTYLTDVISWLTEQNGLGVPEIDHEQLAQSALVGVNVINMANGQVLEDQILIIDNDTIQNLYTNDHMPVKALKTYNMQGKFVIPGLHDMHTHLETTAFAKAIGFGDQITSLPYEELLAPYLANGITTIQVLSGAEDLLKVKDKIQTGAFMGPQIVLASPMLDGAPPILPEPFTKSITDATEVAPFIKEVKQKGYDFVKVRVGLTKAMFEEVVLNARRENLRVVGHIPRGEGLSLEYVVSKEGFGIAHIEEFGYHNPEPDLKSMENYCALLKEHKATVTTTLSVFDNIVQQISDFDATVSEERLKYMHPLFKGVWQNSPFKTQSKDQLSYFQKQLEYQKTLVSKLYHCGVPVMVGTDALNPTIVPGFSYHRELALLLDAGLSPFEILKMATVIPAKALAPNNTHAGTISVGQPADLVIVNSNPLKDLKILSKPQYVMIRGKLLDRLQLDEMLDRLANTISQK